MPSKKTTTPKPKKNGPKTKVVGFRIGGDLERRLAQMAAAAGENSVGDYVRELVLDKMNGGEESQGTKLEAMREDLEMFREDFATAIEAVLVASSNGKPLSTEQARRWVNLRLRHLPEDNKGGAI